MDISNRCVDQDAREVPIRRIFKAAFHAAGLPYFNPHSIRKTLVALGHDLCASPQQLKVWSQNLGHDSVMTTLSSYGAVRVERQAEILLELSRPLRPPLVGNTEVLELVRRLNDHLAGSS